MMIMFFFKKRFYILNKLEVNKLEVTGTKMVSLPLSRTI